MIHKQIIPLLILCFAVLISARCPRPQGLPIKYNSRTFMCARVYEHSSHVENLSCGGSYRNIYNGENNGNIGRSWNDRVSSLVVRPGCHLNVYEHDNYRGRRSRFTGIHKHLRNHKWNGSWWSKGSWNDLITSWSCSCDFTNAALRCRPKEEYNEITSCYNPNPGSMRCQHAVQRGMTIGRSVTQGKSISKTVEASIGAAFKAVFSIGLKTSRTTTYNWDRTHSRSFSKVTTTTIYCVVPQGRRVRLLQVLGRCGDTIVHTGHYECR